MTAPGLRSMYQGTLASAGGLIMLHPGRAIWMHERWDGSTLRALTYSGDQKAIPEYSRISNHWASHPGGLDAFINSSAPIQGTSDDGWLLQCCSYAYSYPGSMAHFPPYTACRFDLYDLLNGPFNTDPGHTTVRAPTSTALAKVPALPYDGVLVSNAHNPYADMVRIGVDSYLALVLLSPPTHVTGYPLSNFYAVRIDVNMATAAISVQSTPTVTSLTTGYKYRNTSGSLFTPFVNNRWTGSGVQWWLMGTNDVPIVVTVSGDAQTVALGSDLSGFDFEYDRLALGDDVLYAQQVLDRTRSTSFKGAQTYSGTYLLGEPPKISLRGPGGLTRVDSIYGSSTPRSTAGIYGATAARGPYPYGHPLQPPIFEGFHEMYRQTKMVYWTEQVNQPVSFQMWAEASPVVIT